MSFYRSTALGSVESLSCYPMPVLLDRRHGLYNRQLAADTITIPNPPFASVAKGHDLPTSVSSSGPLPSTIEYIDPLIKASDQSRPRVPESDPRWPRPERRRGGGGGDEDGETVQGANDVRAGASD
jgi:hypothetical protein